MSDTVIVNAGDDGAPAAEATEAVADATVEIARVEAERDIRVAEIHAETQQAATEADVARAAILATPQRDEELWTKVASLETTLAEHSHPELMARVAALEALTATALSSLIPQAEAEARPEAEAIVEVVPVEAAVSEAVEEGRQVPAKRRVRLL